MALHASLSFCAIDPGAEFDRFLEMLEDEGAVVSFVGVARPRTKDGEEVVRLFLDHHPRLSERSIVEIVQSAASRFDVSTLTAIHRCGEVKPGEPIVFVAAASAHRRAAFQAADYVMDRLKTDAIFWKREDAVDAARWIEPTEADRAERTRWSD
jgi:molybdopterin synthase catalytic subunit